MSQVLADCLPDCRMAVLSGPNLAVEIARRIPAASVIGSDQTDLLEPLQRIFSVKGFKMDAKLKHLELIQDVIKRMANNSFLLKDVSVFLII